MHRGYTQAHGVFQVDCVGRMLDDGCTDSLMHLKGRSKRSWPSYKSSLSNLIKRLRDNGITVESRASGPRGGIRWHIVD